jgi:hypothetical protein
MGSGKSCRLRGIFVRLRRLLLERRIHAAHRTLQVFKNNQRDGRAFGWTQQSRVLSKRKNSQSQDGNRQHQRISLHMGLDAGSSPEIW